MSGNGVAKKAPSLKGRFAAAVALTIGFYVLAIGLAVVLIGLRCS